MATESRGQSKSSQAGESDIYELTSGHLMELETKSWYFDFTAVLILLSYAHFSRLRNIMVRLKG